MIYCSFLRVNSYHGQHTGCQNHPSFLFHRYIDCQTGNVHSFNLTSSSFLFFCILQHCITRAKDISLLPHLKKIFILPPCESLLIEWYVGLISCIKTLRLIVATGYKCNILIVQLFLLRNVLGWTVLQINSSRETRTKMQHWIIFRPTTSINPHLDAQVTQWSVL